MSFNRSCCPCPILSIILLYNKEAVSRTLYSLSASAPRVAATGADTALYNFEIVILKNEFIVYFKYVFEKFFKNFMDRTQITSKCTFGSTLISVNELDAKRWICGYTHDKKWRFNYWRYTLNYAIYRCISNECTPKNGDFFWKNDENILQRGHFITKNLWKHTKIQLSNEGVLDILTVFIVLWSGDLSM